MAKKTITKAALPHASKLDPAMAALAGGAVGFFSFAMPAGLFEGLVAATGLPALVPAAQPPLGGTARAAFVLGAALATFGAVWLLLRALNPRPAAEVRPFSVAAGEPPRLRRAAILDDDAHRPFGAAAGFGVPLNSAPDEQREPLDLSEVEDVDFEAEWERPAPRFLTACADEAAVEQVAAAEDGDSDFAEEAADLPFWLPADAEETAQAEMAPSTQPAAAADDTAPVILPFWAQQAEADAGSGPPDSAEPSLDQLATRLEGGLIRRKRDGRSTRPRGHRGTDDRLRSALDDLTRMSKRS